jgi:GT2 family glycosyltransferase
VRLVDVVVADNSSTDDTIAVAEQPRDLPVRVVQLGRNAGYAAGINAAIATIANGAVDAVLVLNPDITVRPAAVAPLAAALKAQGRAIAVPRLVNPDGTLQPSLRRGPTLLRALVQAVVGGPRASRLGPLGELITDPRRYDQAGPATWATGAAMLVSSDAVQALGPWDESFLLYGEETEFALRAWDRGWELWYEPAAVMEHVGGIQTVTNPRLFALLVVNRVRLFRKRHGRVASLAYHSAVTLGELFRAGRRADRLALVALLCPSQRLGGLPD